MTMQFVTMADGAKLACYRHGTGTPVLLLSGLGGTAAFWSPLVEKQAEQWNMITLDQRGIGKSSRGQVKITIRQLADDCLHVLDALGIEACIMIGHSTGGVITQDLAARHPDRIKAIVLSGSWLKSHFYVEALFKQRLALLQTMPEAYQAFGVLLGYTPEWICKHWLVYEKALENGPQSAQAVEVIRERIEALLAFDGSTAIKHLQMPALVLGARDDAIIPSPLQKELHRALPNSRLELLEAGGHFFPVTRLEESVAVIIKFMDTING